MSTGASTGSARRELRTCALAAIFAVIAGAAHAPRSARAYTYASPLATGCHESISIAALREVRTHGDALAPLATGHDDRVWIDDLPFDLPSEARDLGAASLIVGVRDNDLKGQSGLDTAELPLVHGDPDAQMEHCLRRPEQDEPGGSVAALADCRAFIRDKVRDALQGSLDVDGRPDPHARIEVGVWLAFAGEQRVPMPRFYVQLGRAMHTLQDSFSHALRSPDGLRVRAILNWVDYVSGSHDEARDGPIHRAELDQCEDLDPLRSLRLTRATQASAELLAAASDATLGEAARMRAVDAVLDRYLSYEPGCDADAGFCDAPELAYATSETGCTAAPARGRAPHLPALATFIAALALCRRRRYARAAVRTLAVVLLLAGAGASASASAQDAPAAVHRVAPPARLPSPAASASRAPATVDRITPARPPSPAPEPRTPAAMHRVAPARLPSPAASAPSDFALAGEIGASIDQTTMAVALGGRYRMAERWLLGMNLEWNPWASLESARVRAGTVNAYGTVIWRAPLARDVALRISGQLGAAWLLFDVYGAPSGSVGPVLGLSLLSLELALSRRLGLVLEPADVVVTMPHVTGIPLTRRQYRATVALELWL